MSDKNIRSIEYISQIKNYKERKYRHPITFFLFCFNSNFSA